MEEMGCASGCVWTWVGYGLLWWAVASLAVFATWNYVLADLFKKVPKAKAWQPFLVLFTLAVLCLPCLGARSGCQGGGCPYHYKGKHGMMMQDGGAGGTAPGAPSKAK